MILFEFSNIILFAVKTIFFFFLALLRMCINLTPLKLSITFMALDENKFTLVIMLQGLFLFQDGCSTFEWTLHLLLDAHDSVTLKLFVLEIDRAATFDI
jgi:hypothetical protein